jgi:hypothetical protein
MTLASIRDAARVAQCPQSAGCTGLTPILGVSADSLARQSPTEPPWPRIDFVRDIADRESQLEFATLSLAQQSVWRGDRHP